MYNSREIGELRADVLHRPQRRALAQHLGVCPPVGGGRRVAQNLAHRQLVARRRLRHQQHRVDRTPREEKTAQRRIERPQLRHVEVLLADGLHQLAGDFWLKQRRADERALRVVVSG